MQTREMGVVWGNIVEWPQVKPWFRCAFQQCVALKSIAFGVTVRWARTFLVITVV